MSSNWRRNPWFGQLICLRQMSSPFIITIYGLIGLVLCCTSDPIFSYNSYNQMIKEFLHIERYHIFLDEQLQLQPIQPGKHALCELWIACVCHHIKNGWEREMTGHLWFFRTTTDVVQTTTPNWLTTRDIWWSVLAELAFRPDMIETCLSWQHVADMLPTLPAKLPSFGLRQKYVTGYLIADIIRYFFKL